MTSKLRYSEPLHSIIREYRKNFDRWDLFSREDRDSYESIVEDIFYKCELMDIFTIKFSSNMMELIDIDIDQFPTRIITPLNIPLLTPEYIQLSSYRIPIENDIALDTAIAIQELILKELLNKENDAFYNRSTLIQDGELNCRCFDGILKDNRWVIVPTNIANMIKSSHRFLGPNKTALETLIDGVYNESEASKLIKSIGHYKRHSGNGIKGQVLTNSVSVFEWPTNEKKILAGSYSDMIKGVTAYVMVNSLIDPMTIINQSHNTIKLGFKILQHDNYTVMEFA